MNQEQWIEWQWLVGNGLHVIGINSQIQQAILAADTIVQAAREYAAAVVKAWTSDN